MRGLPRAVPSDALVAAASWVVPGQLVQKVVLVAIVAGAGFGMARLMGSAPPLAKAAAVSWFVWNPYLAERLLLGQWAILVGYAALPWLVAAALAARRGSAGAAAASVLAVAVAALSASTGLLGAAVAVLLCCWPGSQLGARSRVAVVAGVLAVNAPWVVAGLLHRSELVTSSRAVDAFAAAGEGHLPPALTVLGLGGNWNADTVLPSRLGWIAVAWLVVLLVVTVLGIRPLVRRHGRRDALLLAAVAAGCLLVSLAGAINPDLVADASGQLPGAALLRDGPRYLGGLAVVQAMAFGLGTQWLKERVKPVDAAVVIAVALVVAPVAVMPDLAWGGAGRLNPVDYPATWATARDAMEESDGGGAVLVLPLAPYRAYGWNDGTSGLDPAPRYFPGPMLASDALSVDGVAVQPEDPEAQRAAAVFEAADADGLADLGVGFVVADVDPADVAAAPSGLVVLYESDDLVVWQVPGAVAPSLAGGDVLIVTAAWIAAGAALATASGIRLRTRRRSVPRMRETG